MTDLVHIDDLAAPTFSAPIAEMMTSVGPLAAQLRLETDALCTQAAAETGLYDFGAPSFIEPLGVIAKGLNTEARLSPMGQVSSHTQLVQFLKNRLLIEQAIATHPEITDISIDRPIFIAGLPRTGTTHLHNLISSDPSLRSLPYWESVEPLPAPGEPAGDPAPRVARTEAALSMLGQVVPYLERMHEMTTWHVHEEIHLLAIDFSTMLFETMALLPSYRDWYRSTDQTPAYAYLKRILQVLQWARGPRATRWILKSPQHLEQFGPLMHVFPDATVVVTHRDPVAVTASVTTMLTYLARLVTERPDPSAMGRYWAERIELMLGACLRDRALLPPDRSIDVRFHEFMTDDVAMVERIYDVAGQPFTPTVREAMEGFMHTHPRGRHGRIRYDHSDFGLSREERRSALSDYVTRFSVQEEPPGSG